MNRIIVDHSMSKDYIKENEINNLFPFAVEAHKMLHEKKGAGSDFLGWIDLPINNDKDELEKIKKCAAKIRRDSDILIVIGIGGSYLGAKAALDYLNGPLSDLKTKKDSGDPQIIFAGHNISSTYHANLLEMIKGKDVSVNVISKSGTTTEPALAFRLLKEALEDKYGKEEASKRIYATTDACKGALRKLSETEGYETFIIPDDVGGRYSVLTPVGLLPIAVSGADIDKILQGASEGRTEYAELDLSKNDCYRYAIARNILYNKGKTTEILVNYEPSLHSMNEWWKQLFGESEGKDNKGIFPAAVDFSTDLHSMGQYIQDGMRNIFETVIYVEEPMKKLTIKKNEDDLDGLNYLEGKDLDYINKKAFQGTLLAHLDGGVPQIVIKIPRLDESSFGKLVYFFEKACGISGYLLGVNPFDQPGVEAYKKNMFALLGKKGYEKEREELLKRL